MPSAREGGVLVVSYNITLSNYLRDLCRQQYTGNSRDFNQWLTVDYLHGVLRKALQDRGLSVGMDGERGRKYKHPGKAAACDELHPRGYSPAFRPCRRGTL